MKAKKAAALKTKHSKQSKVNPVEQSFLNLSGELAATLKQRIISLKNTEKALKQKMLKVNQSVNKNTTKAKLVKATKALRALMKEAKIVTTTLAVSENELAKLTALKTLLGNFKKNWKAPEKQVTAKAKSTKKRKQKARSKVTARPFDAAASLASEPDATENLFIEEVGNEEETIA